MTIVFYAMCAVAVIYPVAVIVAIARLVARNHSMVAGVAVGLVLAGVWIVFPEPCFAAGVPALLVVREAELGLADERSPLPVLPRAKVV